MVRRSATYVSSLWLTLPHLISARRSCDHKLKPITTSIVRLKLFFVATFIRPAENGGSRVIITISVEYGDSIPSLATEFVDKGQIYRRIVDYKNFFSFDSVDNTTVSDELPTVPDDAATIVVKGKYKSNLVNSKTANKEIFQQGLNMINADAVKSFKVSRQTLERSKRFIAVFFTTLVRRRANEANKRPQGQSHGVFQHSRKCVTMLLVAF